MSNFFVNIHGEPWSAKFDPNGKKKAKKEQPEQYHKGWVVEGHPPGAVVQAEADHNRARDDSLRAIREGRKSVKIVPPWDESHWVMNTKRKRVRRKPYELEQAAETCLKLAEREGWTYLRIVALSKGEA